jgi:hypothetical protein
LSGLLPGIGNLDQIVSEESACMNHRQRLLCRGSAYLNFARL